MEPKEFTKQFLSQIQLGWKVLDVGAGNGYFSRLFVKRGAVVTAVESNMEITKWRLQKMKGLEEHCIGNLAKKLHQFLVSITI